MPAVRDVAARVDTIIQEQIDIITKILIEKPKTIGNMRNAILDIRDSIIMLKDYMKAKSTVRFSRSNVYLRDSYICAYCEKHLQKKDCTLDHVMPVSKGGKTTFDNTVTACGTCNANKGASTKMKPRYKPYKPDFYELVNKRKKQGFDNVRFKEWLQFIQ
jgi:CRISPR/Cas system Type II protein with McrA/HNH and RuvC-like nuclease domain